MIFNILFDLILKTQLQGQKEERDLYNYITPHGPMPFRTYLYLQLAIFQIEQGDILPGRRERDWFRKFRFKFIIDPPTISFNPGALNVTQVPSPRRV